MFCLLTLAGLALIFGLFLSREIITYLNNKEPFTYEINLRYFVDKILSCCTKVPMPGECWIILVMLDGGGPIRPPFKAPFLV